MEENPKLAKPTTDGCKSNVVTDVVSSITPLGKESISRECLIDMFASFDNICRHMIVTGLERSIQATQKELCESTEPESQLVLSTSLENLLTMQSCCQQAQNEFDSLDKDTTKK